MDPFFMLRSYTHFMHPNSALSSLKLVKRAFFSPEMPDDQVDAFSNRMSYYESFLWPFGMFFKFADVKNIIPQIVGWGSGARVMFLNGENDNLISVKHSVRAANIYRTGVIDLVKAKKLDAVLDVVKTDEATGESDGQGIWMRVVKGAAHHIQNDVLWEDSAKRMLEFHGQL